MTEIEKSTNTRMQKSIHNLITTFNKIRTGRAHPSLLDSIMVSYYGSDVPLSQVANIMLENSRTLTLKVWEKQMVQAVEKAILVSDLGLNPSSAGEVIRIILPPLTEETRKGYIKKARSEAENSRISVRNIRRDVVSEIKTAEKNKEISEDDSRRQQELIQKLTSKFVTEIDKLLEDKEKDLVSI